MWASFSIFEPLKTANSLCLLLRLLLWFAFKLVSLNHWKQHFFIDNIEDLVVICFQISIFEPLKTALTAKARTKLPLWFAFKLVSLNHWKQPKRRNKVRKFVVICFQISIFEPLKTAVWFFILLVFLLWFAFKLVSLNHWKQRNEANERRKPCCDLLSN